LPALDQLSPGAYLTGRTLPMPDSGTICGDARPLSMIISIALCGAVSRGANVTLSTHT
jgi:hypothetical protein